MRARNSLALLALLPAAGCLIAPELVTITPEYGFVDGCINVDIQGHDLGENATGEISNGTNSTTIELTPEPFDDSIPEHAQDVGFQYAGFIPVGAIPAGEGGFYDVTLTVDGFETSLPEGFYFRNCPGRDDGDDTTPAFAIEGEVFASPLTAGSSVTFLGCGLDEANVTVNVYDLDNACEQLGAGIALTSVCGTTNVTFDLPGNLAVDGNYSITVVDGDGLEYDFGFTPSTTATDAPACPGLPITVEDPNATAR